MIPAPPATRSRLRANSRSARRAARRAIVFTCLLGAAALAQAQLFQDANDWKEDKPPPPPAFSADKLIPIDMPSYMSLKFGVDPNTISITPDGVVRYVVVSTNKEGNAFNATFEGIHCADEEVKIYARFTNGAWEPTKEPEWKHIADISAGYTKRVSDQGMCRDHAPWTSVKDTVSKLRKPVREVE